MDSGETSHVAGPVRISLGLENVPECRACHQIGQARSCQRRKRLATSDEPGLLKREFELANQYDRDGQNSIAGRLRRAAAASIPNW